MFVTPSEALAAADSQSHCYVMQAVTILTKMLLYNGVPIFFAYMFFGPMKSSVFWKFLHHLPEVLGLHTEIAKSFMTCWAFIGVMVVWEDTFEVYIGFSAF